MKLIVWGFLISIHLNMVANNSHSKTNELLVVSERPQTLLLKLQKYKLLEFKQISEEFKIIKIVFKDSIPYGFINNLKEIGEIKSYMNNYKLNIRKFTPNDTFFEKQWHHIDSFNPIYNVPVGISSQNAWDYFKSPCTLLGDTMVTVVADFGFDSFHSDIDFFKNRYEISYNNIDDDNNGAIDDYIGWNVTDNNSILKGVDNYHGMSVCGGIAAKGNNKIGVVGVAWNTKILPINLAPLNGGSPSIEGVVRLYEYCYKMKKKYYTSNKTQGAYIVAINLSLGVDGVDPNDEPLWCSIIDYMGKAGILSVVAVSNNSQSVETVFDMPTLCNSDYQINVTTYNNLNFGLDGSSYSRNFVHLAAPHKYYTTFTNNSYGVCRNGSSFAAPLVSGAISLVYANLSKNLLNLIEVNPQKYTLLIKDMILNTVDTTIELKNKVVSNGKLNLYKLITRTRFVSDSIDKSMDISIVSDSSPFIYYNNNLVFLKSNKRKFDYYTIYSMEGKEIAHLKIQNEIEQIKTEMLRNGIYFIKVGNSKFNYTSRIIVNN